MLDSERHLPSSDFDMSVDKFTTQLSHLVQVCNSSRLCPEALEVLRTAAAAAATKQGARGAPPEPELLAKLLAALAGWCQETCYKACHVTGVVHCPAKTAAACG
jgi:hypothetical protein